MEVKRKSQEARPAGCGCVRYTCHMGLLFLAAPRHSSYLPGLSVPHPVLAVHHVVVPESVFHSLVPLEVSHKRVPDQLNLGNTTVPSTPTLVNKLAGIVNFLEGSTKGNLFGFLKHKLTLVPLYQLTSTPQTWTLGA